MIQDEPAIYTMSTHYVMISGNSELISILISSTPGWSKFENGIVGTACQAQRRRLKTAMTVQV